MPSHNQLVDTAMNRGVRAGTVLQDAMVKVRNARKRNEYEFELALGEMFILTSDVFKERNGLKIQLEEVKKHNTILAKEVNYLRSRGE